MGRVGVLALQGDFAAHLRSLRRIGMVGLEVRLVEQLERLDALVVPGGESTTLLKLMADEPWFDALRRFHAQGGALFGTCAGAILLSRRVTSPEQPSVGLLDAAIERNAYGRQVDSFEAGVEVPALGSPELDVAFIRAPRFVEVGRDVDVLATFAGEPVLVAQGRILAATFHSELNGDDRLHRYFVEKLGARRANAEGGRERVAAS